MAILDNIRAGVAALSILVGAGGIPEANSQDNIVHQDQSIEDLIRKESRNKLEKTGAVSLERINPDLETYNSIVANFPERPRNLSKAYRNAEQNVWYGFVTVAGKKHVGLFDLTKQAKPNFVTMLEPVDVGEEKFIRTLHDISKAIPSKIKVPGKILEEIDDDPGKYLNKVAKKAKRDKIYGSHVTDDLVSSAQKALEHAGTNQPQFLKAMSKMNETESVLALHLLSIMDNKNYGFSAWNKGKHVGTTQDLTTQRAKIFHENVSVAADVLKEYSWARDQAKRDWGNFVKGVLVPRLSGEHDFGGRKHLFKATKELVKGAKSLEDAVERIVGSIHKVIRYNRGYSAEDGNWLNYLVTHKDRCESMSMFGSLVMRVAGIPNYEAATPWWATYDGNHAWNVVQYEKRDGSTGWFSFLAGEFFEEKGKSDLHVYDKSGSRANQIKVDGKLLKGLNGCARVYFAAFGTKGTEITDITDQCTATTSFSVENKEKDKLYHLCVYNTKGWKKVKSVRADKDGTLRFENMGCMPKPYSVGDQKLFREGLLYAISDGREVNTPFILKPDGKIKYAKIFDRTAELPPETEITGGLAPNAGYGVKLFVYTSDKKPRWLNMGVIKTNEKGGFGKLSLESGHILFITEKGRERPYVIQDIDGDLKLIKY